MRAVAMLLLVTLAACSGGPVSATNCAYQQMSDGTKTMRAMLTNTSEKIVTHVGVLPGDETYEFEFHARILPHQTVALIGIPYIGPTTDPLAKTGSLRPVEGWCWARFVDFADGSNWNVSPL